MDSPFKVGIFDSGLGGLTVVRDIVKTLANAHLYYFADTANAPYGEKSDSQIIRRSLEISSYLIKSYDIDALVVACNSATTAAISVLRENYPELIIVGTEPGVKPAIEATKTDKVGILATPATLRSDKYRKLVCDTLRAKTITLIEQPCPGLVEHIEEGTLQSVQADKMLRKWLEPMREADVDTIVLGCTHYPLAKKEILQIVGENVTLIETGEAIARRLLDLAKTKGHRNSGEVKVYLESSGELRRSVTARILQGVPFTYF